MGFTDVDFKNIFGARRKQSSVGVSHTYGLTALGKTKAEEFQLQGVKWQVAAYLDENGASSVSEIAEETKISPEKLKKILKQMIAGGYVRRVTQDE